AAQKAEEDSKAISEVRATVAQIPSILRRTRNVGIKEGYRITGGVNSGALSTSMEGDTGFERRRVHVQPLILGAEAEEGATLFYPKIRESIYEALSIERRAHGADPHFVIVTKRRPPVDRLSGGPEELPIVAIDDFQQYLIDVKAPTIP